MTIPTSHTAKVVEEQGELFLEFAPDLLKLLGWQEGDVIDWEVTDTAVIVRKSKE